LVTSRLDYANSLLVGSYSTLVKRLQLVQNNAARLITKTRRSEHITPVLKALRWLPVSVRAEFKIILIVFNCLNGNAPAYLKSLLQIYVPSRRSRSSKQTNQLVIPTSSRVFVRGLLGWQAQRFGMPFLII
jgi:hypothetical protein